MPIYEYGCVCGQELEVYRPMDNRYDVRCPSCGSVPQLRISQTSPHRQHITLTVLDGDGNVIGKRNDHTRTPGFAEYHTKEVIQGAWHGQEVEAKNLLEEVSRR